MSKQATGHTMCSSAASQLAAMKLMRAACLGLLLALGSSCCAAQQQSTAESAEDVTTLAVTMQAPAFSLTDDKYILELAPGASYTFILKVLQNDRGSSLKVVGIKTMNAMTGTVYVPPNNNRVIAYRVSRYSGSRITERFSYEVADASGASTKTANVEVTIAPSGTTPARGAKADTFSITGSPGQILSRQLDVLANDGDKSQLTVLNPVTPLPAGATLKGVVQPAADGKSYMYTVPNYAGVAYVDSFRYRVRDLASGAVTAARVDVSVGTTSTPGEPVSAGHDKFLFFLKYGNAGKTWNLPVLTNDKGSGLVVTSVLDKSSGFRGTISIADSGKSITYELPEAYDGTPLIERFKYVVKNRAGQTAQASVTVHITPEALSANPDVFNLKLDAAGNLAPTILDPLKNDTGFIAIARLIATDLKVGDLVWNNATDYFTYTVTGYKGPSFSWRINCTIFDQNGNSDSTTSRVFVDASLAPAPVTPIDLKDDAYSNTVPAGTLLFFNLRVLENDTPDSLKLIGVEQIGATKGSIDVEASKKLLVYQLDSKGLTAGTTFTDRFSYSAVNGSSPTIYKADLTMAITIT
ncbi:hypothetical protein OEZ85_002666 [Tetradesmus obliquus]|uniref:Cadherin domain-containing protein n=1 Tax=Tetradesmus obliquus TaxID=3088 RepID=A0ABY8TY96_TETOB|nr:hypothetical protein OEZ85_002666 [Tetradesmus obliquus]